MGFAIRIVFPSISSDAEEPRLFVADVGQATDGGGEPRRGGRELWLADPRRDNLFNAQNWSQPLESCSTDGLSEPVIAYAHQGDLSAIIGGVVYHGKAIPELAGGYVFGDWGRGKGHLFVAYPPGFGFGLWEITEIPLETEIGQLLGIGQDESGELYLLTKAPGLGAIGNSGSIYNRAMTP